MSNEQLEQKITSDFDKSFDILLSVTGNNRNKIPESLFVNVFLGLFSNQENQHPHATIQNWIAIAGSPFHYVDVVSDNEVLFTVPPIFSKEAINPIAMNGAEPLSHIVSVAEKLSLRSPIEGQNYIDNKYTSVSKKLNTSVNKIEYAQEWNAIFKRYGLPEMVHISSSVVTEKKNDPLSDIKDELRGDDLEFTLI